MELALLLPVLSLLVFGTLELGSAWVADTRVDSATAQAARMGASSGNRLTSDRDLLLALQAALPEPALAHLDRVIVFDASEPGGSIPEACLRPVGHPADVTGARCNSYSGATVRAVSSTATTGFGGGPGAKDSGWPPVTRASSLTGPPDYLGVWVRTVHVGVTRLPFASTDLVSRAVFRIQPDLTG